MIAASIRKVLGVALLGLLPLLLASCSSFMPSGVEVSQTNGQNAPIVASPDDNEDDALGAREHPRIIASYGGIYSDRQAEIMLARIVGRLLAAANQPNQKFTVTILDTSEVNAFALPGGYVYVTRGILALASDTSRTRCRARARDRPRDAEARPRPHQPRARPTRSSTR